MGEREREERVRAEPSRWVDDYGDYLYRYAISRLRDGEGAEEVVQDTFLAALRRIDQYAGRGSERAWMLGILKRKIVDYIRSRNRAGSWSDETDTCDAWFDGRGSWKKETRSAGSQPLDSLEREEFWRILRQCLDGLPTRQADVFALREMDGYSTDEICKDLEISASNLWVLLHRARLQLAKCIRARWRLGAG